jgi:hypothetical protein
VGIKATDAIITAAMEATLSPRKFPWKKMAKFMMAKSQSGIKMVANETTGYL